MLLMNSLFKPSYHSAIGFVILLCINSEYVGAQTSIFRSFEFRGVSENIAANGETDFKGKTETMSTEDRVKFLNAFANYSSRWFGDPALNKQAVTSIEIAARLKKIKQAPLPAFRKVMMLNSGWKKNGVSAVKKEHHRPWRSNKNARLKAGKLLLYAG